MRCAVRALALVLALAPGGVAPLRAQEVEGGGGASLQTFLVTMGPGADVYERFGHNAIWIRDTTSGLDLVYNYGTFDFDEPGFVGRFVFGRPRYWLDVGTIDGTLRLYAYRQRDVVVQELALSPAKRAELAIRLAENILPANRSYDYDYYRDNCSTRVRDILDLVLGGALRRTTAGVPGEGTLRFHTQRSVSNDPAMYLGILAAFGPSVDRPLDQWGEMFLPAKVQQRVRELRVPDGRGGEMPLVLREDTLLAVGAFAVESGRPDWSGPLFGAGVLIALASLTGMIRGAGGIPGRLVAGAWLLTSGIGGGILLFLWFATDHRAATGNLNLLLLSPLALAVLPGIWRRGAAGR
ncbi:MAG: hypothetical protein CVV17_06700, partial [Gammaproteobacteria bacterium HGW-Gammaproteobacteria-7]